MRKIPKTEVRTDWLLVDLSPLLTQSSTFCGKNAEKSGLNGATSPDRFCCKMQLRGVYLCTFMSILGLFWPRFGSDVSLCLAIFPDRMLVMTGVPLTASGACRGDRRLCDSSVFITFRARFRPQNAEFWPNLTLFGSNSSQRWRAVCQPSQCSCRDYEETSASIFPPHISARQLLK